MLKNGNLTEYVEYENYFKFYFETNFDAVKELLWFRNNWYHSITISFAYLIVIKLGQNFMRNRSPWKIKTPLIVWNISLAVFSILGFLRTSEELIYVLWNHGFGKSICYCIDNWSVTGYWWICFAISKVVELGDTAFIVLRKRPLMFLHWYHHITVLIYTWHCGK